MQLRSTIAFMGLAVAALTMGQASTTNLVKNDGFEELTGTVDDWDQLEKAAGWSNANGGSVDVLSKDACTGNVGIPDNELGKADPFAGEHFAGFVALKEDLRPNWKRMLNGRTESPRRPAWGQYSEYLQGELSTPLKAGMQYDVSFRVSLADNSDRAVSGIGALFTTTKMELKHRHFIEDNPQVYSKEIITDKEGWAEIKGSFTATGNEMFIVIGAFAGAEMEKKNIVEGPDQQRAYYYIDGISVVEHPKPDTDGDGIPDEDDLCKDAAGPASLKGCPDSDGDGLADKDDACPDKAGMVEAQGCPDTDGDGLADNVDRCPNVAGVEANKGCPEIKEATRKLFEKALTGIQFETGSSVIRKSSYGILNDVTTVMQENPAYDLEINGHTDSQGDAVKNKKLSEDRAASVLKYLSDKGVDGKRLRSVGHGEDKPIADNATSDGRAKNRRVEFKVSFWR